MKTAPPPVKIVKGEVEIVEKMNCLMQSREESELYGIVNKLHGLHLAMGIALKESGRTISALKEFTLAMKYRPVRLFLLPLLVIGAISLNRKSFRKLRKDMFKLKIAGDMMISNFYTPDS